MKIKVKSINLILGLSIGLLSLIPISASAITCNTNFPGGLDNYQPNDCIPSAWANAMEQKLGIRNSNVTSSVDYQINNLFTSYGSEIIKATSTQGLLQTLNNLSDLTNLVSARSNLGLGDIATHPASDFITSSTASGFVTSSTLAANYLASSSASNFLASSTSFVSKVNNASGSVAIVAGTGLAAATSSSGGNSTTTFSLNINNGSTQTCGAGNFVVSLSPTSTIGCLTPSGSATTTISVGSTTFSGPAFTFSLVATTTDDKLTTSTGNSLIFNILASSTWLKTANNLSDLLSTSSARTNLGLGTAAIQNTGAFLLSANNLSDLTSTSSARVNIGFSAGTGIAISGIGVISNSGVTSVTGSNSIFSSGGTTPNISLTSSTASGTILIGTGNGQWSIALPTSTSPLAWTYASGTLTIGCATCLTGNQNITLIATGDATGTNSGTTSITHNLTVTGLQGHALPAVATGTLYYSGGQWNLGNAVDLNNNAYQTSTAYTAAGTTIRTTGLTVATSGPLLSASVSGNTLTLTSLSTSTILSGYATSSNITAGSCTNCTVTFNASGIATSFSTGTGGGSGSGNVTVSPTSTIVAGTFPFYISNGSSTVSATSSLIQDATGTLWVKNTQGLFPLMVLGTTTAPNTSLFYIAATSSYLNLDTSGNFSITNLGSTTQNCVITSSTAGTFGITPCPSTPLLLISTSTATTTVSATSYTSIATSTFTVATSTNVFVNVAGTLSATGTGNTCPMTVFIDGVNQDVIGNGLSNSGVTLSSQMDGSFGFISNALASGSHTINLELKATGVAAPSCAPSISQFAVNTISGTATAGSGGGSGNGNLFVTPTSSVISNNFVAFSGNGSSTVLATTTLYNTASGVSIGTSTNNGILNVVNASGTTVLNVSTSTNPTNILTLNNPSSGLTVFGVSTSGVVQLATSTIATSSLLATDSLGNIVTAPASTTGWEFLGSCKVTTASSSCNVGTIAARQQLEFRIYVAGYGGSDVLSLRFNSDSGANYWDRYLDSTTGLNTFVNVFRGSQTLMQLAAASTTVSREVIETCSNPIATNKICTSQEQTDSGSAATQGTIDIGAGEWINASAQITSVLLTTSAGQTLLASTSIEVFGKNP